MSSVSFNPLWLRGSAAWAAVADFNYWTTEAGGGWSNLRTQYRDAVPEWQLFAVSPDLLAPPVVIPSGFPTLASTGWQAGTSPPSSLANYPNPANPPGPLINSGSPANLSGQRFTFVVLNKAGATILNSQMLSDNPGGSHDPVLINTNGTAEIGFCTIVGNPANFGPPVGVVVNSTGTGSHVHDCQFVYCEDCFHPNGPVLFENNYLGTVVGFGIHGAGTHNDSVQSINIPAGNVNIRNNTILGYDQYGQFLNDALYHFVAGGGSDVIQGGATAATAIRITGNFCSGGSRMLAPGLTAAGVIIRGNTIDFWVGPNGRRQPRTGLEILAAGNPLYPIGDDPTGAPAGSIIEKAASWDESDYSDSYIYWVDDNVCADTLAEITLTQAVLNVSDW